jgi:tRNA 2-thiouridine synthesizing protein A
VTTDDKSDHGDNASGSGFVQPGEALAPIVVDARGHRCPVPTLRLRRALERAAPGQIVRLLADDPLAGIDVPHFAQTEGFRLISRGEEGGALVFEVTR